MHQNRYTTLRRALTAVVSVAAFAAYTAGPATAQEKAWSLGTSSTGSGPYVNGVVIANHVNQAQDQLDVSAQTTGGYNENLALVAAGRMDVGMTSALDIDVAYEGKGDFADLPQKDIFKNLRVAFIFGASVYHYLTRADSGIQTFEDIKGKNVNLNAPSTFTRGMNEAVLKALGIGLDEINVFSISTGKHFDALQNRVIDVGMHGYQLHLSSLEKLTATTPVSLLSLPDDAFVRLNETFDGKLKRFTIPANTYRGQTEPVETIINPSVLFVNKDASEEDVYAFTKAFWDQHEAMAKESGTFRVITPQMALHEGKTPTHPGAVRYFSEQGLM